MTMHSHVYTTLLALILGLVACSSDETQECAVIDPRLSDPPSRLWCEGEYTAPPWNGRSADKLYAACLPPLADGSCKLCPLDEVIAEVEPKILEFAEGRECALEHWEFGCMRTMELGELINLDGDTCCFQVALWGEGCEDERW